MRVGLAGYGLAGRVFHAPLIASLNHEIVGVLTNNSERIAQLSKDFPRAAVTSNIDQLLDLELDLLVVATANSQHRDQALAAIARGVAVVVDKPFALTLESTQELLHEAARAGVRITAFFNRLWDSDTRTIASALDAQVIGEPFRFDSRFERFRPELRAGAWRESSAPEAGGGILFDLQPHLISTALHLFGPAELISASLRSIRGSGDDETLLLLKHASGVDSYLSASAIIGASGPRIRLSGSTGSLVIHDLDPQEALLRDGIYPAFEGWRTSTASPAVVERGDISTPYVSQPGDYQRFYSETFAALSNGGELPISPELILDVAKIVDQARAVSFR